jgi:hypothetical protein
MDKNIKITVEEKWVHPARKRVTLCEYPNVYQAHYECGKLWTYSQIKGDEHA